MSYLVIIYNHNYKYWAFIEDLLIQIRAQLE
jgi:hypothetical protein